MKFLKLPQEIQKVLLKYHKSDSTNDYLEKFEKGGIRVFFTWSDTEEGYQFWSEVNENLDHFYTKYPKPELIKPEYKMLFKKTFKQNKITEATLDRNKIRELGLEYILNTQYDD